ncbi:MAG: Type 1 glutamine amidotransferase-like domain-containing protein [Ignavibacteria bacterium]|nr:Type 1 glutamine amidotransferase-like domain-containing protein [Ignavibacteria bacterium]
MKKPRQIVALGGGMFSMEPENGLLDKYILNLVPSERPKICFLGTASSDGQEYRDMFYNFFKKKNCEPTHLALTDPPRNIASFIMKQDIIHVGGGNTSLIMQAWKEHGVDKIMKKAWNSGIILTGMSAGAICWFNDGITNPEPGVLTRLPCLGLLKGSFCPHYDERAELRHAYKKLILEKTIGEGYGAEDGVALHFVDNNLIKIVTSRPGASAFRVHVSKHKIVEERLESEYLGKDSDENTRSHDEEKFEVLKTAIAFVEKINEHDIEGLAGLMTDDHKFIDSMDNIVTGKEEMTEAWKGFLSWFPHYEISIVNTLMSGDSVGFFGRARGTFGKKRPGVRDKFDIPASWRAKIENGKVKEWQAIADNEAVRYIIDINGRYEFLESLEQEKSKHRKN